MPIHRYPSTTTLFICLGRNESVGCAGRTSLHHRRSNSTPHHFGNGAADNELANRRPFVTLDSLDQRTRCGIQQQDRDCQHRRSSSHNPSAWAVLPHQLTMHLKSSNNSLNWWAAPMTTLGQRQISPQSRRCMIHRLDPLFISMAVTHGTDMCSQVRPQPHSSPHLRSQHRQAKAFIILQTPCHRYYVLSVACPAP